MLRAALIISVPLLLAAPAARAEPLEFRLAGTEQTDEFQLPATNPWDGGVLYLSAEVALSSADIDTVRADEGLSGVPALSLVFTPNGAKRLEEVTAANVGAHMAVVYEGEVITAPLIRDRIAGGRARIESGSVEIPQLLDALERSGVTVGEAILRPPPPTEEEIRADLEVRAREFMEFVDSREDSFGVADSVLVLTLVEISSVLDVYDADPEIDLEVWRTVARLWPEAGPREWNSRAGVLVGLIRIAVQDGELERAQERADELLALLGTPPPSIGLRTDWGLEDLADACLEAGRTEEAELLCRAALDTSARDMMTGCFTCLVDLLADTGRIEEARLLCEAEIARGQGTGGHSFLSSIAGFKLEEFQQR